MRLPSQWLQLDAAPQRCAVFVALSDVLLRRSLSLELNVPLVALLHIRSFLVFCNHKRSKWK